MTVDTTGATAVVPYTGGMEGLGLEDVTASDLSIPRLNIIGKKALFQNSQTKEEFAELNVVLISQIKQRVLFNKDVDENYKRPQCKSPDFLTGFPNVDPKAPTNNGGYGFPWPEGNFDPAAGKQGLYLPQVMSETGLPALPCDKCKFKEWEGGKTRCKEQHVYPLFYRDSDGFWVPAILTVKGSGIKPSKTYTGGFATSKQPLFTVITHLSLTPASRQAVDYAVPVFRKVGGSDPTKYEEYTQHVHQMREYLRRFPTVQDAEDDRGFDIVEVPENVNAGPAVVPPPVTSFVPPPAPTAPPAAAPTPPPPPAAPPVVTPPPPAPTLPPPAAPPVVAAPAAPPVIQAPAPTQVAPPAVPAIPAGYEAVWHTMPDAAKQAILASQPAGVAPPVPVAPAPATVQPEPATAQVAPAIPAPPAPSGVEDLPF